MRVEAWGLGVVLLVACGDPQARETSAGAQVADEADAAFLAVVEGQVTIRDARGAMRPAAADMSLARSDTVVAGPKALVVVVLKNGHVLRLEEGLEHRIAKLAHIDDPPPSRGVAELFEEQLGADFVRLGGKDKLERIAGWTEGRVSGETPAPVAKTTPTVPEQPIGRGAEAMGAREEDEAPDALDADGLETKDLANTKAPERNSATPTNAGKKKSEKLDRPGDPKSVPGTGDRGEGLPVPQPKPIEIPKVEPEARELADRWTLDAGGKAVQKDGLPPLLKQLKHELAACVFEADAPVLRLKVEGGVIKLVAPIECKALLVDKPLPEVGDGWVVVNRK